MSLNRRLFRSFLMAVAFFVLAARLPALLKLVRDALPPEHPAAAALDRALADCSEWQVAIIAGGIGGGIHLLRIDRPGGPKNQKSDDPLEAPLLRWSTGDPWSIRNACEGTLIFGSTGSGKSSGSGRAIALAMLREGRFGGLVLTAKREERAVWEAYCREAGRSNDLIIFDGSGRYRFNPFEHEARRSADSGGLTLNLVHLLSTILEVADPQQGDKGGQSEDGYWRDAAMQLLRNAVDLVVMSGEPMTVSNLYRIVISAPQSIDQAESKTWRSKSYCFQCLKAADDRDKSSREENDFNIVADYFSEEFPQLSARTRSVVVSTFTSKIDVLNRGLLRELLCTSTNITPDVIEQGKILLIDLPVKEYGVAGKLCQIIFKYAFQRSIERRNVQVSPLPVFLFADEAQNFLSDYDHQFLATCRSARVASVLLTQNLAGLEAALGGGSQGEAEARSLVGHLNTRIFHANSCPHTNSWAADCIGRDRLLLTSGSQSRPNDFSMASALGLGRPGDSSSGFSESIDYRVQPAEFSQLRTGGPVNHGLIDAVVFQNGRAFPSTGLPFTNVTFQQAT